MSPVPSHAPSMPSPSLLGHLAAQLRQHAPFSQMDATHVQQFVAYAQQAYFAPEEVVLEPASGVVPALICIRQGSVRRRKEPAEADDHTALEPGDVFPVAALLGQRAVEAVYTANEDTFCLLLPRQKVQELATVSPPFADFLHRRVLHFLDLSRRATQATFASQALAEQSLEARLDSLPPREPLTCAPQTALHDALERIHARRVGSILVVDAGGAPQGILTRHDVLDRVTLPQRALTTAIAEVMSQPVHALDVGQTLQDAALLMSRHAIRHVPVTRHGRVVNMVSERDLFALQRLSLTQLSSQLRAAPDEAALQALAADLRAFAGHLLGQGVQARQLTELVSHLNDVLLQRLLQLVAQRRGIDLGQACWLAFGSEARSEQTIATDQDNGLIFEHPEPDRARATWLAFGREVNEALDRCGYPLCKGLIMAGEPQCCLTLAEWQQRFEHWMEHGAPDDLLKASIFFDLRPVAGRLELAQPLQALLLARPRELPRFLKQMADNALRNRVPLSWRGAIETQTHDGREGLDLKLHGTAVFVEAARLLALAHGLDEVGTRPRLLGAASALGLKAAEGEAWVSAFEFLQLLRLQVQIRPATASIAGAPPPAPAPSANWVELERLNTIDRRILKEALRVARSLQQRLELDYQR
jgi:CBS domain-containing protein